MNVLSLLRSRFAPALSGLVDEVEPLVEMVRPSQGTKFGDYQANCAMPLGKQLSRPPREIAEEIIQRLEVSDICETPEVAGPGFINLKLRDDWLTKQLQAAAVDCDRLGVAAAVSPRTVVIDYSAPNVAKPMHVGHIRSTVIGDSLYRVLQFLGHRSISDNHIGDWGTQFGMIIYGFKNFVDRSAYEESPVTELGRLYRLVSRLVDFHDIQSRKLPAQRGALTTGQEQLKQLAAEAPEGDKAAEKKHAKSLRRAESRSKDLEKELAELEGKVQSVNDDAELSQLAAAHPEIGSAVLEETAKLHAGDAENRRLWEEFLPPCLEEIEKTYRRLHVTFDYALGESFYHDRLAPVVEDLKTKGIARESDGAMCVFLPDYDTPMIVQKKDGAFLYATTDLATIAYRVEEFQSETILYVVDHRQSLHFEHLFAVAALSGLDQLELQHVRFGTVLGEDGRPFKTRSGDTVGLEALLDEAVRRAHTIVCENDDRNDSPVLTEPQRLEVAEVVGIGALKYADLSQNRASDYVFSYDKMLAMTGNTATYMQYAHARVRSIFARGDIDVDALYRKGASIAIEHPAERALGLEILRFSEALDEVASTYEPHHLCVYLFALAGSYSSFFEQCPVLKAETEASRNSRLLLCDLTARTIKLGLTLLGIQVVEKM